MLRGAGMQIDHPVVLFFAMVVTGAVVYVIAALALCRGTAFDLIDLMKKALRRPIAKGAAGAKGAEASFREET